MKNKLAMSELCTLMLRRELTAESFGDWARRNYGAPHGMNSGALVCWVSRYHREPSELDGLRVLEFDKFIMQPDTQDCDFTRAMIELRNVFARNANMATPETVSLGPQPVLTSQSLPPAPYASDAYSVLAETLARLLCEQEGRKRSSWPERTL